MDSLAIEGGFADPVLQGQSAFRAFMDALANPGQPQGIKPGLAPPPGLPPELAAVALTLCDHDTRLWLAPTLAGNRAVVAYLRFHTGASLTSDPAAADFALVPSFSELPAFEQFALGSDQYPDRSTTIALAVDGTSGGAPLTLRGPGIRDRAVIAPKGLPADFIEQWSANQALFPRGIDLLLVTDNQVIGLPRSTRLAEGSR